MNHIQLTANAIKNWNCSHIEDLLDLLTDLGSEMNESQIYNISETGVDMTSLPSSQKYKDHAVMKKHTDYPIWAVDDQGFCLFGEGADSIEHIENISAYFADELKS